jgi:hypothetical protein
MSHKRPAFELDPEWLPPRWTLGRVAVVAAVVLVSLPFVLEAVALCAAHWSVLTGRRWTAHTPWIDWAASLIGRTLGALGQMADRPISRLPWEPAVVFVAGVVVALVAALPLRRSR